ncbi:MAG: S9 family peptidase [Bacteroidales bacterium]
MILRQKSKHLLTLLMMVFILSSACKKETRMKPVGINPPDAEKKPKELTAHDDTLVDNYYWMNDRNNPEVIEYLKAENEYTDSALKPTEKLQEKLFEEMKGRIKEDDESVPYKKNGYYYYTRHEKGKEYPIYCRKKGTLEAEEEVMLNVNEMAEGYEFYQATGLSVSPDNKLLAYGIDTVGRRKYTIQIKNLETGEVYDDRVPVTTGRAVWANDNETLFYTKKHPETLRSFKIFRHKLGMDTSQDKEIFHESDDTYSTSVNKSKSGDYIFISSHSTMADEYRFLDASKPNDSFNVIQPRERGLEYSVAHYGDYFYIVTNWDAKNFRLMKTLTNKGGKENWEEVIPHREDVFLNDIEVFSDYMAVEERKNGLTQIGIHEWDNEDEHYIEFDEEVYAAGISSNYAYDTKLLRFSYSSMTTPRTTYDYNMKTHEREQKKQEEVLGDFDSENYEAKRLWAKADDGTEIPISMVYRKGIEKNGKNPTLLYGYGSYGSTIDPRFSTTRLSLLDRGFIFAIAHIRGSQYLGRDWYEDGKLLNKKNTFTDFNDCAEHLINENYTNPDNLYAMGGSAGGLLMGAVINMQPELYNGVVAAVPFVDVVTTMLDENIPLTTSEFDEWGNPKEEKYYEYMLSYSPYDNVKEQGYPNMLVTSGLHDSQVQYWEPTKWVAKLRDKKTDDNILLLHTNMEAGHGGASGRYEALRETAREYAFILYLAGKTK